MRQEQRLLELGLFPREAEVDFVPRRVAQPERGQLRAKIANGSKTGSERRRSSGRPVGRDGGGRGRDARADRLERRRQRGRRRRTGVCAKPVQRRIDAVEHARRRDPGLAHDCIRQLVGARRRLPRQEQQLGRALTLVHAARFEAKLVIGAAEQRVESGRRHAQQIARGGGGGRLSLKRKTLEAEEALGLPRPEPVADLFGIARRIGGGAEGLGRETGRGLVMLPAAVAAADEPRDHVGTRGADVPDEIADDLLAPPLLDGLLEAERVAEVDRAREVLLRAVEPVNGEQLLGAQHAERLEDLRPDLVLAAVAARRGHEHRPHALAVAHHREERVVLVVGMRRRFHEGPDRAQLAQHEAERGLGRKLAGRLHPQLRRQRTAQTEQEEKDEGDDAGTNGHGFGTGHYRAHVDHQRLVSNH